MTTDSLDSTLNMDNKVMPDVHNVQIVHPLFAPYCSSGQLISSDGSTQLINILRDSGELCSLFLKSAASPNFVKDTGEIRLIQGVSGNIIKVPLVEIKLETSLFSETVLCGLIDSLPDGVDFLLGNDLWFKIHNISDTEYYDAIVTRSMAKANHGECDANDDTDKDKDNDRNTDLQIDSLNDL